MIMQIVECLGILTLQVIEEDLTAMKVEKEEKMFVTDVIILDTLQGIVEHLIISVMEIKEGMYLYVSYVITLDTQQDSIEWIEGALIGIRITKGTIEGDAGPSWV